MANFSGFIAKKSDIKHSEKKNTYTLKSESASLSVIEGEWSYCVDFDGKMYWKQDEFKYDPMVKMEFTLPSDSLYRDDLLLLKHEYAELAQDAKIVMEEFQRQDRKLRESNKSKSK
jgi:hypothetical protein